MHWSGNGKISSQIPPTVLRGNAERKIVCRHCLKTALELFDLFSFSRARHFPGIGILVGFCILIHQGRQKSGENLFSRH